ncbi:hypothetical protein CU098_008180 [Rhizopus stolonifer]|uniref:EF-hand domain-containing protein n=1 Tax=Rhizopus stolonifer TaxID=4846 RepID=A0A367JYP0_RHIST|nr:hypothetical protein CU098_008180 [Rhizopus stolonifer]
MSTEKTVKIKFRQDDQDQLGPRITDEEAEFTIEMQEDPYFYPKETRSESPSAKVNFGNPFEDQQKPSTTEDSDGEFDWNEELDPLKLKRKKTAKERLQAAIRDPCCWDYLSPLIKRVIIAFLVLDALSKAEKKARPISTNIRRTKEFEQDHLAKQLSSFDIFRKGISNIVLVDKPSSDVSGRLEKNKMDINSTERAKMIAKKLFYSLAATTEQQQEEEKIKLEIHHFIPYFHNPEEAKEAFDVFDKDRNGNLTRREFRDTVVQIYRERKGLAQAIGDTSQALGKIDGTLLVITAIITLFISLSIFQVDFWAALIPFGTFLAACAFIFDTSAKALCQGVVFQFVTHPYDSGDLVLIDDSYMFVENIGILGTVFVGADGSKLYAPTTLLQSKIVCNVRRSGNMGESITFNIDFQTANETILLLRERLVEWVLSQTRDFGPGFDMRVSQMVDMNQLILVIWLPHKGNWVELGKRFQRKTRFMLALKSILTELDIRYELPTQRITQVDVKDQNFLRQELFRSQVTM